MAHAHTVYLPEDRVDYYQYMYDEVLRLNGDYENIPYAIETFHGQNITIRQSNGKLIKSIRIVNLAKDIVSYPFSDNYSDYPYLNFLAIMCIIDKAIEQSPASVNHLTIGLKALSEIYLSKKALENEVLFKTEFNNQLSSLVLKYSDTQSIYLSLRMLANYLIENYYWGFNEQLIFKLDEIKIPALGNKANVSLLDHENGPFTRSEISEICHLIQNKNISIFERCLVKLAKQYGLRPLQLALIRESDIWFDTKKLAWYINIARVKGRVSQLRRNENNFVLRELPLEIAQDLNVLIESDKSKYFYRNDGEELPRPLFKSKTINDELLKHKKLADYAWHIDSSRVYQSFRSLGIKLRIKSKHINNDDGSPAILKMNCYRFRYTLGTRMVMDGKTLEEVAIALDHSTTASVKHYFKYNRDVIDFIDDTFDSSITLKNSVQRWQGFLIDEADDSIDGSVIKLTDIISLGKCLKKSLCDMHPTVSCYGCSRFRPYKKANHKGQLIFITEQREFLKNNSTGPVKHQLDEAYQGALEIVEAQRIIEASNND
ncbi:site-specific integrase [Colwellia demingiae]|uniref:Site-specific integrase n=1 Tax=Colwellia demingiae TaxID=89401 RepID=A0A5C6QRI4_9GAMM|nr:tyrosine-type recombinase/integrase [Colwellia demingiae]TWX71715.1 site-specific integrase [Colwellia demingiae]